MEDSDDTEQEESTRNAIRQYSARGEPPCGPRARPVCDAGVPVASVQETSIRESIVKTVEENEGILLANPYFGS